MIEGYNDIDDIIEAYEMVEIKENSARKFVLNRRHLKILPYYD